MTFDDAIAAGGRGAASLMDALEDEEVQAAVLELHAASTRMVDLYLERGVPRLAAVGAVLSAVVTPWVGEGHG